ncbi:MAG: methylmalonyl-CoA mutase family protein [Desulfobacteria bacterium]
MEDKFEKLEKAYYEGAKRLKTWSGFPVKEVYTPDDLSGIDYSKDIGNPGDYPYTRGIHSNMFRGRVWTKRELCGFGTPADTNKRLKYLTEEGQSGLNFINDLPTALGIDSDHPLAEGEIGVIGVPLSSLKDMESLMEGIPIDKVSVSIVVSTCTAPIVLAQYIALADKRGVDISTVKGTIQNEPLKGRYCGFGPNTAHTDLCLQSAVDIIEYCTKNMPNWYTINVNLYDLRETGINAYQEIGFGFSMAIAYIKAALKRGLKIDEFTPRMAFYCSSHIDFFEEVAKLRAARRLWAKIMKEKFEAKDPRSIKFRFGVHTAGCSLVPQQPMNNIIRVAYEALAAVLSGVQSLHCCSYDEPIALPTEEAHRIALRTQQVLAYETGVANVADPLAGSYYIENLTNMIEEEATRIINEIEEMGGITAAMDSKWLDNEIEKAAYKYQKEIDSKDRIVVGVNEFIIPPEEDIEGDIHEISGEAAKTQIEGLRELRKTRDNEKLKDTLMKLRKVAEKKSGENLLPFIIDAVKAYGTIGEINGTIREAFGYHYDTMGVLNSPF